MHVLMMLSFFWSQDPIYYPPPNATETTPFSEAVRVGELLYLSGKLGFDPETRKLAEGGIQPETKQALENIKVVLERHGASLDQVVKCTVFLADVKEWGAMNEIYRQYFPKNRPARSAVGSELVLGARVEIEVIAYVGK